MTDLTNPRADRVKLVRGLAKPAARTKTGFFLVEGPQSVREAVAHMPDMVWDVYFSDSALDKHRDILTTAHKAGVYTHTASDEVVEAMSKDAQGIVAVVRQLDRGPGALEHALKSGVKNVAVLHTVRDPGNAGTVIRAADAAGCDLVIMTQESVDVFNPKVVRSTAGSLFHIPVVTGIALEDAISQLKAAGVNVLAADGQGTYDLDDLQDVAGSQAAGEVDLGKPSAWLFGNEARGLTPQEVELADFSVRVPIRGLAESLNLSTAATVCLYATSRAQR